MLTFKHVTTPKQAMQLIPLVQQMSDTFSYGFNIDATWAAAKYVNNPALDVIGVWDGDIPVGVTFLGRMGMGYMAEDNGYFHGLFVLPSYRGSTAADGLFKALIAMARTRGYGAIAWLVHNQNATSHGFFKKQGVPQTLEYGVYYHSVDDLP